MAEGSHVAQRSLWAEPRGSTRLAPGAFKKLERRPPVVDATFEQSHRLLARISKSPRHNTHRMSDRRQKGAKPECVRVCVCARHKQHTTTCDHRTADMQPTTVTYFVMGHTTGSCHTKGNGRHRVWRPGRQQEA